MSFEKAFEDCSEVYIVNNNNSPTDINSSMHSCIIFEKSCYQNIEEKTFDDVSTFDDSEYELRMIQCITHLTDIKYDAHLYFRHGGYHSNWWYQKRNKEIPIQCNNAVSKVNQCGEYMAVYYRCNSKHITDVSKSLLKYIGGQTHILCAKHKMPMIPVPDRKAKCKCGNKEYLRCPELKCVNCICQKCAEELDSTVVNEVEMMSLSDNNDLESSIHYEENDDDSSSSSLLTPINDCYISDSDDDVSSIDSSDFCKRKEDNDIDREELDILVTHQIPETDPNDDKDESSIVDEFYIPTTDAGDLPFEIERDDNLQQTRGVNISSYVILNFVGTLLTRQRHLLKPSSIHKYFLQRIVATSIGKSVNLLYPEGMLFPSIFWKMIEGSIIGAIPATLLNERANRFGFASIGDHVRSRLTASGYQTSTKDSYIAWCYDMISNEITNQNDTRMVVNKGLTASQDKKGNLQLRGGNQSSPLLDSVDSKQVIKELMSSQKYVPFTHFLTFTCNMKRHFGTKPIKEWIDSDNWKKKYPGYDNLTDTEKDEIKDALNQAAAPLLLRA